MQWSHKNIKDIVEDTCEEVFNYNEEKRLNYLGECVGFVPGNKDITYKWEDYVDYFKHMQKDFWQLNNYYNAQEESKEKRIEDMLDKYKNKTQELDVKLTFMLSKKNIQTYTIFNNLLDAFTAYILTGNGILKRCPVCGKMFIAYKKTAQYCSDNCRVKAYYHRHSQ